MTRDSRLKPLVETAGLDAKHESDGGAANRPDPVATPNPRQEALELIERVRERYPLEGIGPITTRQRNDILEVCDIAEASLALSHPKTSEEDVERHLRTVLREHWLTGLHCDEHAKTDLATCYCTVWRSEPKKTVGEAIDAWIDHVIASMLPKTSDALPEAVGERFYIDCEFDGHAGPLLSIALVEQNGRSVHIEADVRASDPWVLENVVPLMDKHEATDCTRVAPNEVGNMIRRFIGECERPVIIADSPVDIGRFCAAISTGADGGWASADYPAMRFEVHNVDCYPTTLPDAVQHNAWWDAMALRHKLAALSQSSSSASGEVGER